MSDLQDIDALEVQRIFSLEEGAYLDFKGSDISPAKLSRAISAFANSEGGEVFVGISETKGQLSWCGFTNQEAANPIFQVLECLDPSGQSYNTTFLRSDGQVGLLLHLLIFKSRSIITASDGTPYVRRNAQSLPVKDKGNLKRLELDKGIISYEDQTVSIDREQVTNSETILSFVLNVVPSVSVVK